MVGQGSLRVDGGGEGPAGRGKHGEEGVAFRPDLGPAAVGDRLTQHSAVPVDHIPKLLPETLEEQSRPLDVGEQEGDDSDRQIRHVDLSVGS
jgi:hypothetical protein